MKLDDWFVGVKNSTGEHVYWDKFGKTPDDVTVLPREQWSAADYFQLVEYLLVDTDKFHAEYLPTKVLARLHMSGLSDDKILEFAKGFAEDCFSDMGNYI